MANIQRRSMMLMEGLPCRFSPNGSYGIFGRDRVGSLRLDAGGLDHFGPLLGFGSNVLAEISGWATERCGAEVGKPRLDLGIGEASVDCPVEVFDNLCRRALRRTEAAPEARLITRQEVDQGRDFGQCLRARCGGHRQSA